MEHLFQYRTMTNGPKGFTVSEDYGLDEKERRKTFSILNISLVLTDIKHMCFTMDNC